MRVPVRGKDVCSPSVDDASPNMKSHSAAPREILIVDDDPDLVSGLARILEAKGWKVHQAFGGRQAVEMATQYQPGVILMDIMMPEMNGIEACREIRRTSNGLPVILMTGYSELEHHADEVGAVSVLSKPMDFTKLFDTLDGLI